MERRSQQTRRLIQSTNHPTQPKALLRKGKRFPFPNQQPGAYHQFTPAQEIALLQLLKWLHQNNPAVFTYDHVLGHDEVSPTRKNDPGGALSLTMPELRKKLKG